MTRPLIRPIALAFVLLTLCLSLLAACHGVEAPGAERHEDEVTNAQTEDKCLEVVNQGILSGRINTVGEIEDDPALFAGIAIIDRFDMEFLNLRVLLLEGEGLARLWKALHEPPYDESGISLGRNLQISSILGEGHSPSQVPLSSHPSHISTTLASRVSFTNQWVLSETKASMLYQDYRASQGSGVNIGVFDTSPFAVNVARFSAAIPIIPSDHNGQELSTEVLYSDIRGPSRDHGVFVTSLAHQLAPEATFYLYRVLNEQGSGDVFTLVKKMKDFYEQVHLPSSADFLASVVNISLSVSCDIEEYAHDEGGFGTFTETVNSLDGIITTMYRNGVVIVAAAGNAGKVISSTTTITRPLQAYPASHPYVIGVGAHTQNNRNRLACYSNKADIFLPGADASKDACRAIYDQCTNLGYAIGECPYGVVGLTTAYDPPKPDRDSGIAFWAGTSFASPLMTGLIARLMSGIKIFSASGGTLDPEIEQFVMDWPSGTKKIINVQVLQSMLVSDTVWTEELTEQPISGSTTMTTPDKYNALKQSE